MLITIVIESYRPDVSPPQIAQSFDTFPVTLGRSESCDFHLPDTQRYVSSCHAEVLIEDGKPFLINRGKNGTCIITDSGSSEYEERIAIKERVVVRIGEYRLCIVFIENDALDPFDSTGARFDGTGSDFSDLLSREFSGGNEDDDVEALPPTPAPDRKVDTVEFAAYAPSSIDSGSTFLLDVWAHLASQYKTVSDCARRSGREFEVGRKVGVSVARGNLITVKLVIDDLVVSDPMDIILWNGLPANASFSVKVPKDAEAGDFSGKAILTCQGMLIAKLPMVIKIGKKNTLIASLLGQATESKEVSLKSIVPETAFASYCSEDREEVLIRIHGMKKVAPKLEVFVDRVSLKSGDNWTTVLEREVPSKDIFYLFWSKSAAHSEWVEAEWRLALQRRGLDYIDPIPLEEPEYAPPPKELSDLHFSDAYLSYIHSARALSDTS